MQGAKEETMSEREPNLIDVIESDHREVEKIFVELENHTGSMEHRRQLVDHVIAELVRHSVAEEMFMYPAARKALPDGDELVDHELAEHAEAEEAMKVLEDLDPTDPKFDAEVTKLIADVRHHVEGEENELLPMMRQKCSAHDLQELGAKVLRAKKMAPTRPHPSAPDKPPANLIMGPGAGLIDRMRDALSGRDV
jgi:hemerythrin-like domain-containing protein